MPHSLSSVFGLILLSILAIHTRAANAQAISTVAGTGQAGYSGDGGPATAANLDIPSGIAFDKSGNLLIADQENAVIRKLDLTTGIITTIAGTGSQFDFGDGAQATLAGLYGPTGVGVDNAGNIYVAEEYGSIIRKIDASTGIISTIAGVPGAGFSYSGDGGPAANAGFYQPTDVKLDASGNIYVADWGNNVVRKITAATGIISTVAGHYPGFPGYSGDGGQATLALLNQCPRIFIDPAGNILIGDQGNNVIRKVELATGIIHTIIGSGLAGYYGNGIPAGTAWLNQPSGICMDAGGSIYIADSYNNVIRKVDGATGLINTVAGNGVQGYSGDGGPALNASFYRPVAMAIDASGNMYIADARNNVIRKLTICTPVAPTVSINQSPATACTSNPVFTAVPVNGGNAPAYQWRVNNVNVGTNSPIFAGSALSDGAAVICILTSNAVCATPTTAVSDPIKITGPSGEPAISISASDNGICSGVPVSFTAAPVNGGSTPAYSWTVNGVSTGTNSPAYTSNTLVNGDVIACTLTSSAICLTTTMANSNAISLTVFPSVTPSVSVEATNTTICTGDPVSFTAVMGNNIEDPVYQWQVNGETVGGSTAEYKGGNFSNGDIVLCRVTGNGGCAVGSSAGTVMTVNPQPQIDITPNVSLAPGQSITLNPQVSDDINWFSWSPATGLSDSTIRDPVAKPTGTTLYTLIAKTAGGCTATAKISVEVFGKLMIPNAFTPNGDGKNDIFYVLGGPPGSSIRDLSVYDRWGQKIFQIHNVMPADPTFGWNGTVNNVPAPQGTYIYSLTMRFADGTQQQQQGTLILVR